MAIYTIIGGVNGVGKSSFTGVLKECTPDLGCVIDTDEIIRKHGGDTIKGCKAAISKIEDCIQRRVSFAQETTLSGLKTERTVKGVRELGYRVRMFYIGLDDVEDCLQRIGNRGRRGGHNIPPQLVAKRFSQRWNALAKVLPYCHEVHFFSNINGFVKVAEYQNGELSVMGEAAPQWLIEVQTDLKKRENGWD